MDWIDEFAKGTFGLFAGNTLSSFQPLDFFRFFPMWYDLWIKRVADCIRKLELEKKGFYEIKHLMPPPSSLRAILIKIVAIYQDLEEKNKDDIKLVAEFFARMLQESCPNDPFAIVSNPFHNPKDIEKLISEVNLLDASTDVARTLGKLNTATGSLVHGLYNDVVTDLGWEVYGPYKLKIKGDEYELLIREFPDLSPEELWEKELLPSVKSLTIYNLYKDVEWQLLGVGCHTVVKSGDPIEGMKFFNAFGEGQAISVDQVKVLISEFSEKAETIYKKIRGMNFESLKDKVMLQECYQLKKLFTAAKIDWKPTEEMIERMRGRELLQSDLPPDTIMTDLEKYKEIFEINTFKKELYEV